MSRPKGGLGRGLGAIIPTDTNATAATPEDPKQGSDAPGLRELAIDAISPNQYQPREHFDEEALVSLAESIGQLGVLQPVLVREASDGKFELIAGERRWRAAQRAGLITIPAVVRKVDDQAALEQAVVENLHRRDLNAIEEAAAYQQLVDDFSLTQEQVATRVGKSRSAVANSLRLFQLPPTVQRMIIDGALSAGHARALLGAEAGDVLDLASRTVDEALSVRALEALVRDGEVPAPADSDADTDTDSNTGPDGSSALNDPPPAALVELESLLGDHLDTRVKVAMGQKKGRMTIDFADIDDLERIYRRMMGD